jgi:hypothetical protein
MEDKDETSTITRKIHFVLCTIILLLIFCISNSYSKSKYKERKNYYKLWKNSIDRIKNHSYPNLALIDSAIFNNMIDTVKKYSSTEKSTIYVICATYCGEVTVLDYKFLSMTNGKIDFEAKYSVRGGMNPVKVFRLKPKYKIQPYIDKVIKQSNKKHKSIYPDFFMTSFNRDIIKTYDLEIDLYNESVVHKLVNK